MASSALQLLPQMQYYLKLELGAERFMTMCKRAVLMALPIKRLSQHYDYQAILSDQPESL
jgi:hypothetical protein